MARRYLYVDRPTKGALKISPMYLSRLLCIHRNNTITELLSSILSSLELIRWPYGRARIDREWRKGVIAANWPDHFSSGATRGSFRLLRETIRSRKGARILRNAYEWLCKTFGSRQVRPVLIATTDFETSQFAARFCDMEAKESRETFEGERWILMNYLTCLCELPVFANEKFWCVLNSGKHRYQKKDLETTEKHVKMKIRIC